MTRMGVIFMVLAGMMVPLLSSCLSGSRPSSPAYSLTKTHDSLYYLNEWRLPYPVYRFETGDVDGDGHEDALVGVVKSTRFYPEQGRRLFIFKQVKGKVRPLWLGSKLGGRLLDFHFIDGRVRSLEQTDSASFSVAEWQWKDFGLQFCHFLIHHTDKENATKYFH